MRDRRHTIRGHSLSPRRPGENSRDLYPPRHRNYSPHNRHEGDKYPPDADRSRRIERNDRFDRDSARRLREYNDRGRDRTGFVARRSRSLRRIEKRDHFDRDAEMHNVRRSDYDDGRKDRVRDAVGGSNTTRGGGERENYPRNRFSDGLGIRCSRSPHRIGRRDHFDVNANMQAVRLSGYDGGGENRVRHAVDVDRSRRLDDEDIGYVDPTSKKSQWGHFSDVPKKYVDTLRNARDYYPVGDSNTIRGGCDREYYPVGLLSGSSSKPVSLEYEKGGTMHSGSYTLGNDSVGGAPKSNLAVGEGGSHLSTVASRYLNTNNDKPGYFHLQDKFLLEKRDGAYLDREESYFEKKKGDFHFQDGLNLDKVGTERPVGRDIYSYKKEDSLLSSRNYLKGESSYFSSLSKSKDYVPSSHSKEIFSSKSTMENNHMPSHSLQPGDGLPSAAIGFNDRSEKLQIMSPGRPGGPSDGMIGRSRSYLRPPAEFGTSKIDSISTGQKHVDEEYRDHKMPRLGGLDRIVDTPSLRKHTGGDEYCDPYLSTKGQSNSHSFKAFRSLPVRKRDLDMLNSQSSDLNYGSELNLGYGIERRGERHIEVDAGPWSFSERSDVLSREYNSSHVRLYDSPRKKPSLIGSSFGESSQQRLKYPPVRDESLFPHGAGFRISSDMNGTRNIYNIVDGGDEMDLESLSKKADLSKSNFDKTRMESSEMEFYKSGKFVSTHSSKPLGSDSRDIKRRLGPESSEMEYDQSSFPSHSSNPRGSDTRDLKKRLGPVPQKLHVSQRLVNKPSIMNRLGPAPPKKHATLPWIKNLSSNRMPSIQDNSDGSPHDQVEDNLANADHLPKQEPNEKSEDFKQLVQSAFFKFLKQINETPIKRKKYTDQGKVGNLKCIVCGSNSDEFVDVESLVMHAFTSNKVGFRSQHLGLHKALCVLNGWRTAELPSTIWNPEVISIAEIEALKEDLIIWPPVMVIHNSTIDNKNPDERVVVSTEQLETKLRGMRIVNILRVCNASANQSVMVVKFKGTFSGLREAEKLHGSYVETKRGRAELEQVKSSENGETSTEETIADKVENILYGYLGIAEDLDKLDFDTKKRCVVKSKTEILSIA